MPDTKTILVVDDDPELRAGLSAVLQKRGYRTLQAEDGLQARDLIQGERPDLVLLDMMMPRWSGLVVLEHFAGKTGAPPFIMMTANEGESHKAYARKKGVADYFHKPFPIDKLLAGVDKVLATSATLIPQNSAIIRCRCLGCGARIKAPAQMRGQTRQCPGCQQSFVVRPEMPEDQGPILVMDDSPRPARRY